MSLRVEVERDQITPQFLQTYKFKSKDYKLRGGIN
jgi:hypothetical protein